jgi:dUTPase
LICVIIDGIVLMNCFVYVSLSLCSVKAGDRIAQLVLERIAIADVEEVEDLDATSVYRQKHKCRDMGIHMHT